MKFGIRFRLVISLFILMLVALWLTAVILIKDADERLDRHHRQIAEHQAKTLAEGSLDALVSEDYELLERWVASSLPNEKYAYAALVRPNGQVLTHTDLMLIGEMVDTSSMIVKNEVRYKEYLKRPVAEMLYSSNLGKKHFANAHVAYYLDIEYEQNEETFRRLIGIMALSSIFLMAGVYIVTDKVIKPIRLLTNDISGFTLDRGVRFSPLIFNRSDEVGALARSFDKMAYRLSKSYKELKVAHDSAIESKDQAELANLAKSEFISNISHELRTPMHAIMGYSELGTGIKNTPEKSQEYFEIIKKSGARLMRLIDSLLDISKLETGKYVVEQQSYSMIALVDQCRDEKNDLLKSNKIEFVFNCEKDAVADFDVEGIHQVVLSLLSNAIKFGKFDSKICIDIKEETFSDDIPCLHFVIQNEGPGIPKDELSNIFEHFVQSSVTNDGSGGTGLGLSISKRIIEAHNGKMWAENAEDNSGAIFHFLLPIKHVIQS